MDLLLLYSKRSELIVVLRAKSGNLGPSYCSCSTFTSGSVSVRELRNGIDTFLAKPPSLLIADSSDEAQVIGFNCDLMASSFKLAKVQ